MMKTKTKKQAQRKNHNYPTAHTSRLTFLDHVRELQGRLFWVAIAFVTAAAAAYPFFDEIIRVLVRPLGSDHQLVYLTPGGGFGFIVQVCMYIGVVGALPAAVYHLYRFVAPSMRQARPGQVFGYAAASLALAVIGIVFAYVVSLPAALYFLTSFDLQQVTPMLTIDSYFSFIIAYLLAGALLFQLPLLMLIVNAVRPQGPQAFMKYQRHIIVGAFIFAAVVSPTPDALNQAILAVPMIVMYQLGGVLVWLRNRRIRRSRVSVAPESVRETTPTYRPIPAVQLSEPENIQPVQVVSTMPPKGPTMSGDVVYAPRTPRSQVLAVPARPLSTRSLLVPQRSVGRVRSVDGFGFVTTPTVFM